MVGQVIGHYQALCFYFHSMLIGEKNEFLTGRQNQWADIGIKVSLKLQGSLL